MTTNNHPAQGPVSLERLHQISEILSKASAQSDGGNLGYAIADAVKVIDGVITAFGSEPVAYMYKDKLHADARFSLDTRFGNWSQEDINEYEITETPLYAAAQPAPVVPAVRTRDDYPQRQGVINAFDHGHLEGWNACRAAMLQAGNSPVSPDGSVTGLFNSSRALLDALYEFGADEVAISEHVQNLEDALRIAAAPQQEDK